MYDKNFNDILNGLIKGGFFVSTSTLNTDELKQKVNNVKKNKEGNGKFSHGLPVTNIYEDGWSFRYELLTPGFTKKDINITIENEYLLVEGEREKRETNKKLEEGGYISKEYHATNFNRSFILPDNVVCEEIHAKVSNGITTIFFPKEKKSNSKTHNRKIIVD
jgi:HSP20 family molecular chaperone IbpA